MRGPNVTPGYWRDPALTRAAFDDDGFYAMGDALGFVDPADPARGFMFQGRIAEDFKLSTGTWVRVGPLRAALLARARRAGAGRRRSPATIATTCGVLIFPNLAACRRLAGAPGGGAGRRRARRRRRAAPVRGRAVGASARRRPAARRASTRAMLLDEPPSIDAREITDKGSINQKAVLRHRAALVDELYGGRPPTLFIDVAGKDDRRVTTRPSTIQAGD